MLLLHNMSSPLFWQISDILKQMEKKNKPRTQVKCLYPDMPLNVEKWISKMWNLLILLLCVSMEMFKWTVNTRKNIGRIK